MAASRGGPLETFLPLGGVTLFTVGRVVYGFGGLSFDDGATNGLIRLDGDAWTDVVLEGAMPSDARAAAGAATLGSRVYLVGGATLATPTMPARAPGRVVLDFASDPPTITRDAAEIPGGIGAAAGFVGTTMHAFDGFDPNDSESGFDPASFRRLRADGPVEGYFVFGVTTPPPLVSALAGWTREGSLVYGGRNTEAGPALSGAWTFEGGVQRAVMLDGSGSGPGARAEISVDTRAMIGRDPDSTGFPWTVFGGGTDASERAFFVYDRGWEQQTFVSGGPSPVARGAMVARTQGCGPSTFLLGGRTTTEVLGSLEAWGCTDMTCSWESGLPSPGLVTNGTLTWDGDRTLVLLGGLANNPTPPGYARVIDHCVGDGVMWRDIELSAGERVQMQRYGHTTTSLGFGSDAVFVMVGGVGLSGELIDEVVGLRISGATTPTVTGEINPLPMGPSARVYHTALRSRDGDRLWIVGGRNRDGDILSDVWELRRP
ncbi:MAG: kelch repeat-containing protein [Polyangiales bacterium]